MILQLIKQHLTQEKKSPRRGIEPRSGTRQAPILTIKLSRNISVDVEEQQKLCCNDWRP